MTQRKVLEVLKKKGYIVNWHSNRFRLMDRKRNPVYNVTAGMIKRLQLKDLIKKEGSSYVYKKRKERTLNKFTYECTIDNYETVYLVIAEPTRAKYQFYQSIKPTHPGIRFTDVRCRKKMTANETPTRNSTRRLGGSQAGRQGHSASSRHGE